jgi:hypothetical protein
MVRKGGGEVYVERWQKMEKVSTLKVEQGGLEIKSMVALRDTIVIRGDNSVSIMREDKIVWTQ